MGINENAVERASAVVARATMLEHYFLLLQLGVAWQGQLRFWLPRSSHTRLRSILLSYNIALRVLTALVPEGGTIMRLVSLHLPGVARGSAGPQRTER